MQSKAINNPIIKVLMVILIAISGMLSPGSEVKAATGVTVNDVDSYGIQGMTLYQFDGNNPTATPKASVTITGVAENTGLNGLAVAMNENAFYAATYSYSSNPVSKLYRINENGTAQFVTQVEGVTGNSVIFEGKYYYVYGHNGKVYIGTYDLSTKQKESIEITNYSLPSYQDMGGDMIFDSNGYVWLSQSSSLLQLNPKTGTVVRSVNTSVSDGVPVEVGFRGMSFLPNGNIVIVGGQSNPKFYVLDRDTLSTTYIGAMTGIMIFDLASEVTPKFDPNPPELESKKTVTIQQKATGNTDAAHPEVGDTLLYTIQSRNIVSNSLVSNLVISDTIPVGLDYVPGTLRVDKVSVTDAQGDDKGHYAAGKVAGQLADIVDTNWHTVQFEAIIQAGQAGKNIRNVAEVTGDNIDTPDKPGVDVNIYPPANQPPMASDTQESTWKNTPVTGSVYGVDPDGDQLTFTKGSDPTNGTVTVNPDGTWMYEPDTDFTGTDSFTVTISDGKGGTITSTVTVNVTEPPNLPPVTENYDVTTEKDTSVTGSVYGTDPDGDTVTYTIGSNPKQGMVIVNSDGTWKYTPDPGYVGPDIFTVTVSDGKGGVTTSTVTVTVKDKPNSPPVSPDREATTEKGKSVTGDVYGTDPDGDPLTYTPGKQPGNGDLIVNPDGSWKYTPDPDFVGEDSFTVIVDDGKGGKIEVEIIVDVKDTTTPPPTNQPPVSPDKEATTEKGKTVTGDVYGTDPEGDPLTYTPGKQPGNGTVIVNPDGSWIYTPDPDFVGEDSFTVIVDDGKGNKTEVTVTVRVTEPNTPPTNPGDGTNPTDPGNGTNPTNPGNGTNPTDPGNGTNPTNPGNGTNPTNPGNGTNPTDPGNGTNPTDPGNGTNPTDPGNGTNPTDPGNGTNPTDPGNGTTPEDSGDGAGQSDSAQDNNEVTAGESAGVPSSVDPSGTPQGNKLPNTSTNVFNLGLAGLIALCAGLVLMFRKRKLN